MAIRPFNFLQFNTGVNLLDGFAVINPLFEKLLTGSGMFTPALMLEHGEERYIAHLDSELNFYPTKYSLNIHGEQTTTSLHNLGMGMAFRGVAYPVSTGDLGVKILPSGEILRDNLDNCFFDLNYSGNLVAGLDDEGIFDLDYSGKIFNGREGVYNLGISWTGLVSGYSYDNFGMGTRFAGNLIKYERDTQKIDIIIESVSWDKGNPIETLDLMTGIFGLNIELSNVGWRTE